MTIKKILTGDDGKMSHSQLSFSEIINLDELKKLFEAFSTATGFSTGLVDLANNEILLQTGWRDICSGFHRAHPDSIQHCKSSNLALTKDLQTPGEIRIEHCQNGMVDGCTPIIIEGIHFANLCTGQVFFSPPDINRFKEQALQYGYDEQRYLDAVAKVPVVEEKQLTTMLRFLAQITMTTIQHSMSSLQAEKSHKELLKAYRSKDEMEKTLQKSESQLRQIIDLVPHFIFVKDETGQFEIVNKATAEVFGITVEDLTGRRDAEFVATEEEMERFRADDLEVIQSGKTKFISEEPITDSENNTRYLQTTKVPFKFSATNKPSLLGIAVDISERVQLEKELKKERQRLHSILEGTNVGTWEWNVQTGETIFNEHWADIIGYTLDELSPTSIDTWMKFAHPDDLKISGTLLEKHFSGELDYYEFESRMRHKNGDWIWILDRGKVAVWTEEGKPLWMSGTHQDITTRKVTEEALQNSHDTLEQRVAERTGELEKIHAQLRHVEKLSAMGQFTASIAHEINNPLTGVLNVLERLQRKVAMGENEAKLLAMALNEGDRMKRLIQDLQSFNRPSSDKKTVFELQKTVETILQLSRKELHLHHVSVETHFAPRPIEINGVEDQIKQVFLNLMRNAMDAIPDTDGMFDIAIAAKKQLATISFHDNGCGIKPEHLGKIFDSFFTTKPAVKGTGLGLSVSYNIIKAHGGDMSVSSEPDKGTTFTITLPINPTTTQEG